MTKLGNSEILLIACIAIVFAVVFLLIDRKIRSRCGGIREERYSVEMIIGVVRRIRLDGKVNAV